MATTTTTNTNTGGFANSLNTPARADEDGGRSESLSEDDRDDDDVSVDCGTIGSIYDEEYIQVYRERIPVGGSFFPPENSESGSGRWECNGMVIEISSLFPATKSETDSSSLSFRSNSNSIMAIFPPHRSTDGSENDEIIIARNPSISSLFPAYFSDSPSSSSIIARNPSISSLFPAYFSDSPSSVSNETRLDEWLVTLGIEKLSISEIEKLEWKLLNGKMNKWVQTMKSILSRLGTTTDETETVKGCVMQLLNFGKAVAIGRRSPEKLFRILDMYDVMAEVLLRLEQLVTDDVVINEAKDVLSRLGEAARGTFAEFENAVQSQTSKTPMQSGEIHHLTRYVMNYAKFIVKYYSETLNLLLDDQLEPLRNDDSDSSKSTPVARRLLVLITSLHSNLEEKSNLYEDGALRYLFLMNNILYVVQKVKHSGLRGLLGDNWVLKQHGQITQYAVSYLRASWTKVLHCLKDEGIGGSSSNASRMALKKRFKNFNTCFEEIRRVQTAWKVPNAQLREELRIFISEMVIPAYRSVLGRFGNQVESGRDAGKYIKYTVDDLESYLLDLFEGSPRVLHHMGRKNTQDEIIIARNPTISSLFPAYFSDTVRSVSNETRLDEWLVILGIEKLSISEIGKLEWKLLDGKMNKWVKSMKIILSGLGTTTDETKEICFNKTVKGCVMQLLNFGKAVAIGRRSPEKLFRILQMYDVMAEVLPRLERLVTDDVVINEARDVLSQLGEAARGTFAEFENAVQSQTSKPRMQSDEIHPLTRHVMNYVKRIVKYRRETLNLLEIREDDDQLEPLRNDDSDSSKSTPVARRLLVLITSLHSNLEEKLKFYEGSALQYIFLMNNILYVVQKVKHSGLLGLLGDNWVRKQRGQITQYIKSYLSASWTKVLHCLKDEGIGGSLSNASRMALKERFKNFNTCFEEIYRVQTAWKVPNAQLREELRISISEKVIPAYRSFMGRFGNQVESGRVAGKYIKYTVDDLENYLSDLFEGSQRVLPPMGRKTT